ncbi:MAG: glucosaminidase domain-containing protein [Patescibacteria group bacterium]|nr:glucosaminidase domain-containing protein [Patescibacteria group bacterium]
MNKQKLTWFLQSFVAIPMVIATSPLTSLTPSVSPTVAPSHIIAPNEASVITTQETKIREKHAEEIDKFLASYHSPLTGLGMKFVTEAEKNNIDYRLLVAIAGRESTFGLNSCKGATNSFLGYGSCKINFKSPEEAIERVSASLGGNNENTKIHYAGKNTVQILRNYNSIIPNYPEEVIEIMKSIDNTEKIA